MKYTRFQICKTEATFNFVTRKITRGSYTFNSFIKTLFVRITYRFSPSTQPLTHPSEVSLIQFT